jgi:hypothetical protein
MYTILTEIALKGKGSAAVVGFMWISLRIGKGSCLHKTEPPASVKDKYLF